MKCSGASPGWAYAVHAEEVRGIDHGREHVAILRHAYDVLSGVRQVHRTLPRHYAKHVEREQHARRMQLGVGMLQEVGNHVRAMPGRDARSGNRTSHLSGRLRQGSGRSRTGSRPRPGRPRTLPGRCCIPAPWDCDVSVQTSFPFSRHAFPLLRTSPPVRDAPPPAVRRGKWLCGRWRACLANAGSGPALARRGCTHVVVPPADDRTEYSRCRRCP